MGWPSPRPPGSMATATEYTRPLLPKASKVSTVRHSKAPYKASPALKAKLGARLGAEDATLKALEAEGLKNRAILSSATLTRLAQAKTCLNNKLIL